jgi:uncharacterized membrane protein
MLVQSELLAACGVWLLVVLEAVSAPPGCLLLGAAGCLLAAAVTIQRSVQLAACATAAIVQRSVQLFACAATTAVLEQLAELTMVHRQNVEVTNAEWTKRRTTKRRKTKRRMGQNIEWKKRRMGQNVEWN